MKLMLAFIKKYIKFINKFNNLIIIRTFSKSFGLAGLRAGYAVGSFQNIKIMNKFRPMYELILYRA